MKPYPFNRYRHGARKHARADVAAKIDNAVKARWQPLVRKRRQKQAATSGGITVETRARFGYTAPVGRTDDGRFRRLTVHLPPAYAQRLFDARDAGASDQQMRGIAEGFKEVYFQDGGGRAMGLSDVEIKRHRLPGSRLLNSEPFMASINYPLSRSVIVVINAD